MEPKRLIDYEDAKPRVLDPSTCAAGQMSKAIPAESIYDQISRVILHAELPSLNGVLAKTNR